MRQHQGTIHGGGQCELHFRCWEPDTSPRALVLVVHGAGEHSGRYEALAQFLCARGCAVACCDLRGHGRSQGRPGYIEHFARFVDDLAVFHRHVVSRYPELPQVLLGHSMGGLIAAHYLLRNQREFQAAVLSAPLVMLEPRPGRVQTALVSLLGTLWPRLGLVRIDAGAVSRDPQVVAAYRDDPLVFQGRMSARQVREMFAAMALLRQRAEAISLPLLLLHGEADTLTAPAGSRLLQTLVNTSDCSLKLYPGLYHEIFNEPEGPAVCDDLWHWLEGIMTARD